MNRRPAALLLCLLALTGCAPGWEGVGQVIELELMDPETQGTTLEHEGLEISVLTTNGTEASVHVEDCDPGRVIIGDTITVADVESLCGPVGHSQDD